MEYRNEITNEYGPRHIKWTSGFLNCDCWSLYGAALKSSWIFKFTALSTEIFLLEIVNQFYFTESNVAYRYF